MLRGTCTLQIRVDSNDPPLAHSVPEAQGVEDEQLVLGQVPAEGEGKPTDEVVVEEVAEGG